MVLVMLECALVFAAVHVEHMYFEGTYTYLVSTNDIRILCHD